MKPYKSLLAVGLAVALSGCKFGVMVPAGGEVTSLSGSRDCDGRSTGEFCTFEITTDMLPFSETFTAHPKPGYAFVRWQGGDEFLCPDSTAPTCAVTLDSSPLAQAIVGTYGMYYIMPVFKDVGFDPDGDGIRNELDEDDDNDGLLDEDDPCPLNPDLDCGGDTIVANGKEWFQPDLFVGLSRPEIDTVCPSGVCNGLLNGFNMDDWTWAASVEVQALFESYGPVSEDHLNCSVVDSFFGDGWRRTNSEICAPGICYSIDIAGWTSTDLDVAFIVNTEELPCSYAASDFISLGASVDSAGAWFYRIP